MATPAAATAAAVATAEAAAPTTEGADAGGNAGGQGNGPGTGTETDTPGNGGNGGGGNNNAGSNGNGNAGSGGNGNAGSGGNGNRGNGNRGNGNRGNGRRCVDPPATPAVDALAGNGRLPRAKAGKSVNVEPIEGAIAVKQPGDGGFERLSGAAHIPEGSFIDARAGTVELTSAGSGASGQQTATFNGAKFQVIQSAKKAPVTDLVLRGGDFRGCPRLDHARRAQQVRNGIIASRTRRGRRALWGSGQGRFRTRGRWGSATVRGTVWRVEDTCGGTRTTVARGVVDVADFGLNRRVKVRAGQTYLAKVRR